MKLKTVFVSVANKQKVGSGFLENNGYKGQVVLFSGTNNSPEASAIYEAWLKSNQGSGRITGSRDIDIRTALIEYFRDTGTILIATEAAAEGVNIQFPNGARGM